MPLVMGVDVAGSKKGFHFAVADSSQRELLIADGGMTTKQVLKIVESYNPLVIAIDCPPRCEIIGPKTRLSERQMNLLGVTVQWTPRPGGREQEWMKNGEFLWRQLEGFDSNIKLIETFPTATARQAHLCDLLFPIKFLEGNPTYRKGYKDLLDASLCAWTAIKYLQGTAQSVGHDPLTGEQDELGPIFF